MGAGQVLAELGSAKAAGLRDDARRGLHELIAPDIFPVEIGHALTRAERQGRISIVDGWAWWQFVMADAPTRHPLLPLMPRAYAISSATRQGVYDCLDVALAERENCELVTADNRLVNNLRSLFPFVVLLAAIP